MRERKITDEVINYIISLPDYKPGKVKVLVRENYHIDISPTVIYQIRHGIYNIKPIHKDCI